MRQEILEKFKVNKEIEGDYELPESWRWVRLGNNRISKINPSKKEIMAFSNDLDVSFIPMSKVDKEKGEIVNPEIKKLGDVKKGYTYFKESDVIFAKITPSMENGKCAIARNLTNELGFGSTEFHVIRPIDSILPEWIWYYLRQQSVREEATKYFTGTVGQQRVPKEFIEKLLIPLPPLEEQKSIIERIERLFNKIVEIKKLRKDTSENTKTLLLSALHKVFSKADEKNWKRIKLEEVVEHRTGIWGESDAMPEEGYPILRSTNIISWNLWLDSVSYRKISAPYMKIQEYILRDGDIIVTKSSGSANLVGESAVFYQPIEDSKNYIFSNFTLRLRCNKRFILPKFLYYYLKSPLGRKKFEEMHRTTSGLRNLKMKAYMNQPIPLLSVEEQKSIVAYLDKIQEKAQTLQKLQGETEKEIEKLIETILNKAFRGEL